MYLSRLILNSRSSAVRRDLADCQQLHRTILSAFPQTEKDEKGARAQFGLLYRADVARQKIKLLVQSIEKPDWDRLPKDYLVTDEECGDNPACKSISESYRSLTTGTKLIFQLRANPTRKIDTHSGPNGERRNGKRVELRKEEDQIAWIERKAKSSGFQILSLTLNQDVPNMLITEENKIMGWRKDPSDKSRRLTFASVLFNGELEVVNAELFQAALANGIGSGKAYGFGLLSIAPSTGR